MDLVIVLSTGRRLLGVQFRTTQNDKCSQLKPARTQALRGVDIKLVALLFL